MKSSALLLLCVSAEALAAGQAIAQPGAAPTLGGPISASPLGQSPAPAVPAAAPIHSGQGYAPRRARSGVEEVVVTAQRRSENLQKVPIAITAITAKTAAASGVAGTQDLSILTPGLNFETVVGNATPYLRGVGTSAVGAGNEPPVATYVDGVYIAAAPGALFSLNNIDRVEVLKGPQGTLFGRNATGGLIQVITHTPSMLAPRIDASVGYGNYQTFNAQFYGSTPISDAMAADFAFYLNNQGRGWGRNDANGQQINKQTDLSLRQKFVYHVNAQVTVTTSLDYTQTDGSIGVAVRALSGTLPLFGIPFTGNFHDINSDHQPSLSTKTGGASVQVRADLDVGQFVSISSYRQLASRQGFDQDNTPVNGVNVTLNEQDRYLTQEFQVQSPSADDRVRWIGGVFYFYDNAKYNPVHVTGLAVSPLAYVDTIDTQVVNSLAAYGQVAYRVFAETHLTAGFRYTYDFRTFNGFQTSNFGQLYATPGTLTNNVGAPSARVSLDHTFAGGVLGYISYNRGFKSGIFNGDSLTNPPLQPETLDAYEAGFKARFMDNRVQLNGSGFYYNYTNIQLMRTQAGLEQLLNAAAARIYGVDIDSVVAVTPQLTIRGGLEALHGTYTSFPNAIFTAPLPTGGYSQFTADGSGKHITNAPSFTADLAVDYTVPTSQGDLAFNVTVYYNSGWYAAVDNRITQPSYELLNAQITFKPAGSRFQIRVWGKNLTGANYFLALQEQSLSEGGPVAAPLTFGAALDWSL